MVAVVVDMQDRARLEEHLLRNHLRWAWLRTFANDSDIDVFQSATTNTFAYLAPTFCPTERALVLG